MEAELAALAASGATTVIGLMATDGWNAVRARVVALMRRDVSGLDDAAERERVEGELELERREAAEARAGGDTAALSDLEAVWRTRLRRLLTEDPAAAATLRALVAEHTASASGPMHNHNTISGGEFHRTVIQAGRVDGGVHGG